MLFSSTTFIFGFLPIVLLIYFIFLAKAPMLAKNIFLLLASLFFYAWGEPKFVLMMILSIVLNWLAGLFIDKWRQNKARVNLVLALVMAFNIGILFIYKYLIFSITTINQLTGSVFDLPNILLPIGISFFTFQAISYVIDVKRGTVAVQKNPLYVALYISFFPQLVAGPTVRYSTIAEQINDRTSTFNDKAAGLTRFIIGLAKKALLADNLAIVADKAFSMGAGDLSTPFAWLGVGAFMLQIYFDFSGYSDMAIGLGRIFGFRFLENFNYPYISKSISEFWRRWHISLGSWFRDYVYFPLGGSRVASKKRLVFNLFVVWMLTGVWHGANWTFILWGLFYFAFIAAEKLSGFELKLPHILKHVYTLAVVIFGWVLFRSVDLGQTFSYMQTMLGLTGTAFADSNFLFYLKEYWLFFVFGGVCSLPIIPAIREKLATIKPLSIPLTAILVALFIFSVSFIIKGNFAPFIYFNF